MVPLKVSLIAVRIEESGLIEHPVEMLFADKLYLEVLRSLFIVLYGSNAASIEAIVVISRPPAVLDDQPEAH